MDWMNKELPRIAFEDEVLNNITQGDLARRLMDQKRFVYKEDVEAQIGDAIFNTINCENIDDFLDKYQDVFSQIGINPFSITSFNSGNDYAIRYDDGKNVFSMTTEDCDNISDFRIKNQKAIDRIDPKIVTRLFDELGKVSGFHVDNSEVQDSSIYVDITASETELNQKLEKLQNSKRNLERTVQVLDKYRNGELDNKFQKHLSFDERKKIIQNKMETLKSNNLRPNFEEAVQAVNRLNSFIVNEDVKNNIAMPYYNKALETRDIQDIEKAIEVTNQLDDSHMYKKPLLEVLNSMGVDTKKEDSNFEEAVQTVNRLNSFIVNEDVKNNIAMPYYNKALETRDIQDIEKAIEVTNQLDDSHMYKKPLLEVLNSMRGKNVTNDVSLESLVNEYEKIDAEEKSIVNYVTPIQKDVKQRLDEINLEIEQLQEQIANQKEKLPVPPLPKSNESEIMEDTNVFDDLTPKDNKPHIIKSITKASSTLISKVKNSKFGQLMSRVCDFLRKHKVATIVATASLFTATALLEAGLFQNPSVEDLGNDQNIAISSEKVSLEEVALENNTMDVNVAEEEFNLELQDAINDILDNQKAYKTAVDAINGTNSLNITDRQKEKSWDNATPGAYYNLENGLNRLSQEEAESYWQDGGTVAVRMDNNGTPVGFISVNQQEDTSGKTL